MMRKEIIFNVGSHDIVVGEEVDCLYTQTNTNTTLSREKWRTREIMVTINEEKAREFIELLKEYIEYKEAQA